MAAQRTWCPTCRRREVVEEVTTEGQLCREGEREWTVTWLACGHTLQAGGAVTSPAPGAPYAGCAVAPSVRVGHQVRVDVDVDPWADAVGA